MEHPTRPNRLFSGRVGPCRGPRTNAGSVRLRCRTDDGCAALGWILRIGAYFPDDARTGAILQRAEYLKSRASPGLVFFSVDCYPIAKLAGFWPDLPVTDIFWECLHEQQFAAACSALTGGEINEILLDPQDWLASSSCHLPVYASERRYLLAIRERIAQEFDFVGAEAGWELWRRRRR